MKDRKAGFSDAEIAAERLKRVLTVKDLTLMGIAAVIGAGIFSTIGNDERCFGMLFFKFRYAVLTAFAYAYSSMAVQILKILFNAPRPIKFFEGIAPIRTIDGYAMHEWNSFPSGHTASAFTLAVVLSYILPYKNSHLILVPLAVLTAFSRVYLAQHFMEDIIAGSLIAVIMTLQLIYWLEHTEWYHSKKLDGRLFEKV